MAVRFANPVGMLTFYVNPVHEAGVALESIGSILDAPVMDEPAPGEESVPEAPYDVVLDRVSFGYTPGREVIHDASLSFPAGGVTALVGPSGSGKSTIARLVARFWDVDAGSVSVGGVDVRSARIDALMERVAMVFQDVYLLLLKKDILSKNKSG